MINLSNEIHRSIHIFPFHSADKFIRQTSRVSLSSYRRFMQAKVESKYASTYNFYYHFHCLLKNRPAYRLYGFCYQPYDTILIYHHCSIIFEAFVKDRFSKIHESVTIKI